MLNAARPYSGRRRVGRDRLAPYLGRPCGRSSSDSAGVRWMRGEGGVVRLPYSGSTQALPGAGPPRGYGPYSLAVERGITSSAEPHRRGGMRFRSTTELIQQPIGPALAGYLVHPGRRGAYQTLSAWRVAYASPVPRRGASRRVWLSGQAGVEVGARPQGVHGSAVGPPTPA